jgi:CPA2 family monovalent cation:H+ antiporter-2
VPDEQPQNHIPLRGHTIIAGFGVPGRAAADACKEAGLDYCVIELNAETVRRCGHAGVPITEGDVADEHVLVHAGVEHATTLMLLVPNEQAVLTAVPIARRLNAGLYIVARCNYTSNGLEAHRRGANESIVAEQVVAQEVLRLFHKARA